MTEFVDIEESRSSGRPVFCVRIVNGATDLRLTTAEVEVTLGDVGLTFQPGKMTIGSVEHTSEAGSGGITFTFTGSSPAYELFNGGMPFDQLVATVYASHHGLLSKSVKWWEGRLVDVSQSAGRRDVTGQSLPQQLQSSGSGCTITPVCEHDLYDAGGCKVRQSLFTVDGTLTAASGSTVQATAFATKPDGWFTAGKLYGPNGAKGFIVAHVGQVLTLLTSARGFKAGDAVKASAGCDRSYATCGTKFSNRSRFSGDPNLSPTNPFAERVY